MATFDKDTFEKRHKEVAERDPEWTQFDEEERCHNNKYYRLNWEVRQLEKQKNEPKYEEERKVFEKNIAIKPLERDLANSKMNKALDQRDQRSWELERDMLLQEMKTSTSDVMKSEIQRLLEEAERGIHAKKELANKWQSEANSLEKRLELLKKEGDVKAKKSGPIEDPDRLFKDMSEDIAEKYMQVGIDLRLTYQTLQNELETVQFNTLPTNRKAMKMLHLWKDNTPEGELTYSALAAALEKNDLTHCADKYCYTTATTSHKQPASTASGVSSFQHNAPLNTATSLDQPASTLTQQHTTVCDVKAEKRKRVCDSESEEVARIIPKVVKPGTIKDLDCLFKDMSKDIGDNAPQNTASSLDQPASTLTQQHTTDDVSEQIVSTLTPPPLAPSDEVDSSGSEGRMSSNEQLLKEDEARSTSTGDTNKAAMRKKDEPEETPRKMQRDMKSGPKIGIKWPFVIAAVACVVFAVLLAMMFQNSVVGDGGYTSMAPQQEEDIKSPKTFPQMEQFNPLKRSGGKSPVTDKVGKSDHELRTKLSKDDHGDTHTHAATEDECMKSLEKFAPKNELPKMEQLYLLERSDGRNDVRIIERIGANNHELGTKLLEDDHGVKMQTIEDNARGKNEKINHEIFRRWLTESKSEVNWKVLLDTLIKVKFKQLACDIVDALNDRESKMTL